MIFSVVVDNADKPCDFFCILNILLPVYLTVLDPHVMGVESKMLSFTFRSTIRSKLCI